MLKNTKEQCINKIKVCLEKILNIKKHEKYEKT